jgi:D-alanyl-D-alanine carboxypeptidase
VFTRGKKLYASNETVKCEVGCLTKLMAVYTILTLAENISGKIMVPAFVENLPSPKADLNSYNYLNLEDILYALIFRGANDALWTILYCIAERLYGIT